MKSEKTVFSVDTNESQVVKVLAPGKMDMLSMRILIFIGLLSTLAFIYWLIQPEHIGNKLLFILLAISLAFKILRILHEWYHYYSIRVPEVPEGLEKPWSVDMLTTFCAGEPYEMILETLEAMVAVEYPHQNYLCDEADDPYLKSVCQRLGVIHVTRKEKIDAKAGNINNALKQAKGEICVVLDPDHKPHPKFLHEVLPYFKDENIGYVQVVQPYKNQKESFVARGAAEQTYQFYGPIMMAMGEYNTAQAIGANCTFRRKALDSIGGHAAGLSEDMHTAMLLHAKGWKSVYVPSIITKGLVPSSLSGYYKQQLKWSRGTFDLLFYKLPQIFKNFSWRQKIHYLTIPIYFFFGFITLIDLLIPILGLTLMDSPLKIETSELLLFATPFVMSTLLIRLFSQKWTLEEHEKGLHIVGGILYTASWWVFVAGFIYTILKVKVPYIPTPKDDKPRNEVRLSLPSLLVSLVCLVTVAYGLSRDWTPYSLLMASFAGLNGIIFFTAFLFGQQKFMLDISMLLKNNGILSHLVTGCKVFFGNVQYTFYYLLRQWALPLLCLSILLIGGFTFISETHIIDFHTLRTNNDDKYLGGFYVGWNQADKDQLSEIENAIDRKLDVQYFAEPSISLDQLKAKINLSGSQNRIPFLRLSLEDSLLFSTANQLEISYLNSLVGVFRTYQQPVFLSLLLQGQGSISAVDYAERWQNFVLYLERAGVHNITWVWEAGETLSPMQYYPGNRFVDWIAIQAPSKVANVANLKLSVEYDIAGLESLDHPVMLLGADPGADHALSTLEKLTETQRKVRGLIFESKPDQFIDYQKLQDFLHDPLLHQSPTDFLVLQNELSNDAITEKYLRVQLEDSVGTHKLLVEGKEFYIKSICYNPEHDWRDHHRPLTRPQLEKDFARIKAMGANTIRRYEPGSYDKNILNIAQEYDLMVLYGFWFDPEVDYLQDSALLESYRKKVIQGVNAHKDHHALLAWGIGNETWGILKKKFHEPYLSFVRQNYVRFLNDLAKEIHEIDPHHPVFTAGELLLNQTESEVRQLKELAPELDFIAINAYYEEQIGKLDTLMTKIDPSRPYLVSEFGPNGYWDTRLSNFRNDTLLLEESSFTKAHKYATQWKSYILPNKGKNIGGSAFCWSDRMEGSATWFGLVDDRDFIKPGYYALQSAWTGNPVTVNLPDIRILGTWYNVPVNEQIEFSAAIVNDYKGKLDYRWYLCEDEYLDHVETINIRGNGNLVSVTIPDTDTKYRLYVHATDTLGNVVTASKAINAEIKTYL